MLLSEGQALLEPLLAPALARGSYQSPSEHLGFQGALQELARPLGTLFSHLYSGADGVCSRWGE